MRRNNLIRTVITAFIVVWAVYQLFPTYSLIQQRERADAYITQISEATGLGTDVINQSLNQGSLPLRLQELDKEVPAEIESAAAELSQLHAEIVDNEARSIKQGLDLQGGTYLVYEVDSPKLVLTEAKTIDSKLESIIEAVQSESIQTGADFLPLFKAAFDRENLRMNKYYGSRTQSNDDILASLEKDAEDAVDRTLEVIRNRVDRFGVSEPSITKQGGKRIVIELAGIDDVGRAKKIIGDTALLEFKLVKDSSIIASILQDIDARWKQVLASRTNGSTPAADSAAANGKQADSTAASAVTGLEDILGTGTGDSAADTSLADVTADPTFAEDQPFLALLRNFYGSMAVPEANLLAVQRIINHPEVKKVVPDDVEILFYNKPRVENEDENYFVFEVVKKEPELTGSLLESADVTISSGSQSLTQGEPQVSLKFNREGARLFARVTGANVGKRLAIILDGKVASAPNINERIPSGDASIHGAFTMQEANELAIVLRAGALPAPIQVIEERTVGPSLGADSVRRGQLSIGIGILLVIVFMGIYYKLSGLLAVTALILNLVLLLAVLAVRGATLTLPGVAGIILTIGIAVDANVLIFERIREELRTGKTPRAAIDSGYGRAFWTIFDANVTTLLTALVLFQFGTGPIRGFALTLMIGIIASMFTAIVVTRIIFDYFTQNKKIAKLSI